MAQSALFEDVEGTLLKMRAELGNTFTFWLGDEPQASFRQHFS